MVQPPVYTNLSTYDLLGYSADEQLRLLVEVKSRAQEGATRLAGEWFTKVSQHSELYALFITPTFMLLRLPEIRRRTAPIFVDFTPQVVKQQLQKYLPGRFDYAINSMTCLDAAIDTERIPLDKLTAGGLERVVSSWLNFALLIPAAELQQQPVQSWLVDSGLHEVLTNGQVVTSTGPQAYGFAA